MRPESFRPPVVLEGRFVRLVPLATSHAAALEKAWKDPEVRRFLLNGPGLGRKGLDEVIPTLLDRQANGTDLAFTTVRASDGIPVGMTRFLHVDRPNDAVEIGGTWLDRRFWRTPFNTESKYLLLSRAFDREGAHRVCLQTDVRNARARRSIEGIGAIEEATLREDRLLDDGRYRSSVFYAIVRSEWPRVKEMLEQKLARDWSSPAPPGPQSPAAGEPAGAPTGPPQGVGPANSFRPPVTLRGRIVELVPLERRHIPDLVVAGRDPEVWRLLRIGPGRTTEEMTLLVEEFLAAQDSGAVLMFVVLLLPDRRPAGMFRFLDIDRENRWAEVGTWLDPRVWRTPVNTELKYLGLRYAFEDQGAHRIQLRTDSRNERSQRAIERLGGVREGVHREHIRLRDGSYRTSIVYSILASEWPGVKQRLEGMLARPWERGSPPTPATTAGAT